MKFALYFEYEDGTVDDLTIEGDTIQELRDIAEKEKDKRNPKYFWSKPVDDFEV